MPLHRSRLARGMAATAAPTPHPLLRRLSRQSSLEQSAEKTRELAETQWRQIKVPPYSLSCTSCFSHLLFLPPYYLYLSIYLYLYISSDLII